MHYFMMHMKEQVRGKKETRLSEFLFYVLGIIT